MKSQARICADRISCQRRRGHYVHPNPVRAGLPGPKDRLLERMEPHLVERHLGQLRQGRAEAKGERIIAKELKGLK